MRVACRPVVRVLGREAERVLVHVEAADEDRAGSTERRDRRRVARRGWILAIDARSGERRDSRDVEQVLHGERHAGERTRRAPAGDHAVDPLGVAERAITEDRGEAVELGVAVADAFERRRHDRAGRDATRGDGAGDFEGGGVFVEDAHRLMAGRSARARRRRAREAPRAASPR